MLTTSLIRSAFAGGRAFCAATRANVTITFALALIPMIAAVGAAVDYSRAASARTAMQAAIDASALMLSKNAPNLASDQISAKATEYFNAQFHRSEVSGIQIIALYTTTGGSQIVLNGTGSLATVFMGLLGISQVDISASSTVQWGNTRLRVALVLDTTGSMASAGKMTALKNATRDLLDQLQTAAASNGDVYVSIIPFSKNVNLGGLNYNANWVDWTGWEDEPAILKAAKPSNWSSIGSGSSCPFNNSSHGFVCTSGPVNDSPNVGNIPSSGTYRGYICPSVDSGRKDATKIGIYYNGCYTSTTYSCTGSSCSCTGHANCTCQGSGHDKTCKQPNGYYEHTWVKNARSTWNGCVTDRGTASGPSGDYDRNVTAPVTGTPASLFPAEQNSYCSPEVLGLTFDWAKMRTVVNNLYPNGATNQPIGLVWGWQSLVGGGPLTVPAKDSNYTYKEVIVLMSDGLNTLDRWYGNGSDASTAVDRRMYESATLGTCANIKAAGIIIYAIHVNTDGDPMSTLLKNCASGQDKFWMVTSAGDLGTVFNTIGTQLSNLRVAK
jgi:Flp pilus assembly protein TadG